MDAATEQTRAQKSGPVFLTKLRDHFGSQLNERLKAAGRHIKRGLLLYGPPGSGKTLTF